MLRGKTVILGVTGGIAAYKAASLASLLVKQGCEVHVIMTEHALNFISPVTFETLTGRKCLTDTFDRNFQYNVEHVSLAKKADLFVVAPATANVIGKLAAGIADDMLTTTMLACRCSKLIVPAMNTNMYENSIVQENMEKLRQHGFTLMEPSVGRLACGDTGIGKFPPESEILDYILREIAMEKDMAGKKVLITAGPTREPIDPVRFLTNHSSGKMGYALAVDCMQRGAEVTLVSGKTSLEKPPFMKVIHVETAGEMFEAVTNVSHEQDIILMSAAVADYTPAETADEKVKKKDGDMLLELKRTKDILKYLGENRSESQYICGFSMETENMLENSKAKLDKKQVDMIVANNLKEAGAGFGVDTNKVTIITKKNNIPLPLMSKEETAHGIMDEIMKDNRRRY